MPKVLYSGPVRGFRGKIGGLIFRQLPDGTIMVSAAPPENTGRQKKRAKLKRSPAQQAHNSRFKRAAAYAKWAQHAQPLYAELAAAAPMKTAYNFALSDGLKPPTIHQIERREGCIRVQASDEVLVSRVRVTVLDHIGNVLEVGEAVRAEGDWWELASQAQGKTIKAEAWDLPRNHVTLTAEE